MVRIPCFHCCGSSSVPGWETEIPKMCRAAKKKRKKLTFYFPSHPCLLKAAPLLQNKIQDTENHTQETAKVINYYNPQIPLAATTCQKTEHCQSLQKPLLMPSSIIVPLSLIVTLLLQQLHFPSFKIGLPHQCACPTV